MTRRKIVRSWWASRRFRLDGRANVLLDLKALAGFLAGGVALAIALVAWTASWSTVLVLVAAGVGAAAVAATGARLALRWNANREAREKGAYYW